jgi:zinc D-Ala-D-Ala carboxypeptidase
MKLSQHFTLEEMTKSQTGSRKGIENTPGEKEIENLKLLCENILEKVRVHFGRQVTVNSGYRGPKLNKAIGGAKNSQHMTGQAADIEIAGMSNKILFCWIRDNLDFDQLILEFHKEGVPDSGWVHVSWNSQGNRKQVLTIG